MSIEKPISLTGELVRLAWPVLVSQLAVTANGVVDTAMAGRLSAVDLAAVGIGASIQVTVLMSAMGVLLAPPPLIAHLYGAFTFMALFIARLGPIVSGAHQIAANIAVVAFMLPLSIGNAAAVLAGQALGARRDMRARKACWYALGLGMAMAAVVSLTLWFGAARIAALYTRDVQVRSAAAPLIALVALYHLADALQAVAVNALRGYKKSMVPMLIYTVALWGLGLGGGVALGLSHMFGPPRGAAGFWIAAIASLGLTGGLVALYLDRVSRPRIG